MTFYWLYDLPNWLFGTISVAAFSAFGVIGLYISRNWVKHLHQVDHSHNDIVSFFLAAVTVFYGITLGLVTVGTWNTFASVENKVDAEAQVVASIYRDLSMYEEPLRGELQKDLKDYTHHVITISWPEQRKGIVPAGSGVYLDNFLNHLGAFKPKDMAQNIIHAEVFKQFNLLIECRRARLNSVLTGLPASIWTLVIIGGLITIIMTLFFDIKSFNMHLCMTILLSALLGLMVFLVGTLDHPFRGSVSVGSEPLERIYNSLMNKGL